MLFWCIDAASSVQAQAFVGNCTCITIIDHFFFPADFRVKPEPYNTKKSTKALSLSIIILINFYRFS